MDDASKIERNFIVEIFFCLRCVQRMFFKEIFLPGSCACMRLLLRRTLVQLYLYSTSLLSRMFGMEKVPEGRMRLDSTKKIHGIQLKLSQSPEAI